ncbi:unnamed protein product [Danaus chrysippus]|uniref:(African queen) hypothetical protein n=1 Tax=Danaus chrysippus TaxID=151541 RepID=A0A8J2QTI2_9NEOP|nr:unnamed protein product [Danaus chrysippus]
MDYDKTLYLTSEAFKFSGIEMGYTNIPKYLKYLYHFNILWLYTDVFGEFFWLCEGIAMGKSIDLLSMVAPCSALCILSTAKTLPMIIKSKDMSTYLLFIPFLVNSLTEIFLMCFFGDQMIDSSYNITQSVYNSNWYEADEDVKKSVLLILFRSQQPCKITAANFADLHLRSFTTSMKNAAVTFMFLVFLSCNLAQIFLLCYFGDLVMKSSMEVSSSIYNSMWYKMDAKSTKSLLIVHFRSLKPCKLTAFGFSDVSLKSFMSVSINY